MRIYGAVETAKISTFGQLEVVLRDKEEVNLSGKRPQYNCRVVRGWNGLDDVQAAKKNKVEGEELYNFAVQAIPLPPEDAMIALRVIDIVGKQGYHTLVCIAEPTGS